MGHTTNMGDCATDLAKTIMPLATAGGIYDWSGTQASHVYAEEKVNVTKPEIDAMVKGWWDGTSDGWSSEKDYMALAKDYKPSIGGQEYVCLGRQSFGDGDCMHVFRCKTKKKGDKTMACYAHSDYTLCLAPQMKMKERPKDLPWLPCNP